MKYHQSGDLLTPKQAAKILQISVPALAVRRVRGTGPPFKKLGKLIRYPWDLLMEWIENGGRQKLCSA